jgi:hypothetical protein
MIFRSGNAYRVFPSTAALRISVFLKYAASICRNVCPARARPMAPV